MKTLIVDDEPINLKLFIKYMQLYGQCVPAMNGQEAVEKFKHALDVNIPFELVLLDIMMPQVDGHEALRNIRSLENEYNIPTENRVKIIMTTALSDFKNVQTAFNELADGYLVKPIDKPKLIQEINKLCNTNLS